MTCILSDFQPFPGQPGSDLHYHILLLRNYRGIIARPKTDEPSGALMIGFFPASLKAQQGEPKPSSIAGP